MATGGARVTVSAARTLIATKRGSSQLILVNNPGPSDVDLGGTTVTSGEGFLVAATKSLGPIEISAGSDVYGVVTTGGTQVIHVFTVGQ